MYYSTNYSSPLGEMLFVSDGESICGIWFCGQKYFKNNIVKGVKKLKGNLSGIVCNCRNVENEEQIVNDFAKKIGTHVIGTIHRSNLIQDAELDAKTVIEKYPESQEAQEYRDLASSIMSNENTSIPEPMNDEEFEAFFKSYL